MVHSWSFRAPMCSRLFSRCVDMLTQEVHGPRTENGSFLELQSSDVFKTI